METTQQTECFLEWNLTNVICWDLRRQCELRVQRGHKVIHNRYRMDVLTDMLRVCLAGMSEWETQTMRDHLAAMCDLSDDEQSPRFETSEENFQLYVQQAYQAYQIGRGVAEQVRRDNAENVDQVDNASETEGEETNEERYYRYVNSNMKDVCGWRSKTKRLLKRGISPTCSLKEMMYQMWNIGTVSTTKRCKRMKRLQISRLLISTLKHGQPLVLPTLW